MDISQEKTILCSDWTIPEQVVTGDAQLSSGNVRILGSAARGQDELLGSHCPLLALLVDCPQGVGVHKLGILVQIVNLVVRYWCQDVM